MTRCRSILEGKPNNLPFRHVLDTFLLYKAHKIFAIHRSTMMSHFGNFQESKALLSFLQDTYGPKDKIRTCPLFPHRCGDERNESMVGWISGLGVMALTVNVTLLTLCALFPPLLTYTFQWDTQFACHRHCKHNPSDRKNKQANQLLKTFPQGKIYKL